MGSPRLGRPVVVHGDASAAAAAGRFHIGLCYLVEPVIREAPPNGDAGALESDAAPSPNAITASAAHRDHVARQVDAHGIAIGGTVAPRHGAAILFHCGAHMVTALDRCDIGQCYRRRITTVTRVTPRDRASVRVQKYTGVRGARGRSHVDQIAFRWCRDAVCYTWARVAPHLGGPVGHHRDAVEPAACRRHRASEIWRHVLILAPHHCDRGGACDRCCCTRDRCGRQHC